VKLLKTFIVAFMVLYIEKRTFVVFCVIYMQFLIVLLFLC